MPAFRPSKANRPSLPVVISVSFELSPAGVIRTRTRDTRCPVAPLTTTPAIRYVFCGGVDCPRAPAAAKQKSVNAHTTFFISVSTITSATGFWFPRLPALPRACRYGLASSEPPANGIPPPPNSPMRAAGRIREPRQRSGNRRLRSDLVREAGSTLREPAEPKPRRQAPPPARGCLQSSRHFRGAQLRCQPPGRIQE